MNKLTIILFLTFASVFGQKAKSDFEISGNLKVLFGKELLNPIEATVELQPGLDIVEVDSLGNFKFSGLKSGIFELRVLDYNIKPKVFHLEISDKSIKDFDIIVNANCEINTQIAKSDIENGKPKLILIGGIAPIYNYGQEKFEKKYGFVYYDFGCTPPPMECINQYNKIVFDYLDKRFGKKWRKDVRDDVIGLK